MLEENNSILTLHLKKYFRLTACSQDDIPLESEATETSCVSSSMVKVSLKSDVESSSGESRANSFNLAELLCSLLDADTDAQLYPLPSFDLDLDEDPFDSSLTTWKTFLSPSPSAFSSTSSLSSLARLTWTSHPTSSIGLVGVTKLSLPTNCF